MWNEQKKEESDIDEIEFVQEPLLEVLEKEILQNPERYEKFSKVSLEEYVKKTPDDNIRNDKLDLHAFSECYDCRIAIWQWQPMIPPTHGRQSLGQKIFTETDSIPMLANSKSRMLNIAWVDYNNFCLSSYPRHYLLLWKEGRDDYADKQLMVYTDNAILQRPDMTPAKRSPAHSAQTFEVNDDYSISDRRRAMQIEQDDFPLHTPLPRVGAAKPPKINTETSDIPLDNSLQDVPLYDEPRSYETYPEDKIVEDETWDDQFEDAKTVEEIELPEVKRFEGTDDTRLAFMSLGLNNEDNNDDEEQWVDANEKRSPMTE